MEVKQVNYYVKYLGTSDSSIQNGEVYECIAEWYRDGKLLSLAVIDDTEEDYLYSPKAFEKVSQLILKIKILRLIILLVFNSKSGYIKPTFLLPILFQNIA